MNQELYDILKVQSKNEWKLPVLNTSLFVTLTVKYGKEEKPTKEFIHKGIAKRSFDFAWKISNDLNISNADAKMDKGLLCITIPYAKERAPKRLTIK